MFEGTAGPSQSLKAEQGRNIPQDTKRTVSATIQEQRQMLSQMNDVINHVERSICTILRPSPPNSGNAAGPKDPVSLLEAIDLHNMAIREIISRLADIGSRVEL